MTTPAEKSPERILPAYKEVGRKEISEAVYMALGAASVCWEPMDCTGTFQSERAAQIGEELLGLISQYYLDRLE